MHDSDPWSTWESLESFEEPAPGSGSCDDEFVSILTLAMEQGSTVDILMELLEDLTCYEQEYGMDLADLHHFGPNGEALDIDFLLWSRTYYRFLALSSLTRAW